MQGVGRAAPGVASVVVLADHCAVAQAERGGRALEHGQAGLIEEIVPLGVLGL